MSKFKQIAILGILNILTLGVSTFKIQSYFHDIAFFLTHKLSYIVQG